MRFNPLSVADSEMGSISVGLSLLVCVCVCVSQMGDVMNITCVLAGDVVYVVCRKLSIGRFV